MSIFEVIVNHFNEHIDATSRSIETLTPYLAEAANLLAHTLIEEHKILCCTANSAAAAGNQFCSNLLGTITLDRPSLPVQFLGANVMGSLSPIDNPNNHDSYARQIDAFARHGDLLLLVSSSNNEASLINAIHAANQRGMHIIAITAGEANDIPSLISNEHVNIPLTGVSDKQVLNLQFLISQILADLTEQQIFGGLSL